MKKTLSTSKVILFLCISLAFSLSYKTLKAQKVQLAAATNKEEQKGADSLSLSYIVKYKIRAINTLTYNSEDSTLNNAKLASKDKSIYDREGNLLENINENGTGKIIQRIVSKFDSKSNLTEYVAYDSTNKISYQEKRYYDNLDRLIEYKAYDSTNKTFSTEKIRYDDLGRVIESSSTMPLSVYSFKREDDNKTCTYTYRSKYDLRGNLVEYTTDSAGVIISKTVSKFDNKDQILFSENYDHNVLQSTSNNVYDKKGGFTQTIEYYWTASKTQCSPNKNRTVTKYDNKGNIISSISISDENGAVSTTKTTSDYQYSNTDKLLSLKSVTETKSDDFFSKATTSATYKYDKNGNEIESVTKYGGGGSGTYTTKTEYNSNNEITKQTVYNGTCMDKPSNIVTYVYYPDGKTLKELKYEWFDYPSKSLDKYDERSIPTEHITINESGSSRTVYTYEYW